MEIVIGKIRISEGQMMKKKVLVFYGLNLLITVFLHCYSGEYWEALAEMK